jgi:hypothetical protein
MALFARTGPTKTLMVFVFIRESYWEADILPTELLPHAFVFRYLTVRKGFSRFRGQPIPSRKSIPTMGVIGKWTQNLKLKPALTPSCRPEFPPSLTFHDIINIS